MEQEKEMNERESLLIIQQMINTAKREQKDDGKGWIIWGWMLFLASILTVINMQLHFVKTFFFWDAFGLITLVAMVTEIVRDFLGKKRKRVKTYTQAIFEKLNVGFFICLMFIIMSMNLGVQPVKGFSLLLALYGFWILIYGALLDFKPSIIGAFFTWAIGLISLFQNSFTTVMLLHGIAVLGGYIIPGHIAYSKFKQLTARNYNTKTSGV